MGAKVGARRRGAFLRAFAACGNVTVAAELVGVSRSWVSWTRRREPGFDAAFRAALAKAQGRLRMAPDNKAPPGWERSGGRALALFGRRGRVQLVRSERLVWTAETEARFLAAFERCCNVKLACQRAGITVSSYERHQRRWPGFRLRMRRARALGSERLAAALAAERAAELKPERVEQWLFALPGPEEEPRTIKEVIDMVERHKFRPC